MRQTDAAAQALARFDTRARRKVPIDADLLRIPVGPGSMHVERYGHGGAPIVMLHGFGTSSFLWRNIAPEIALANRTAFLMTLELTFFLETDASAKPRRPS